MLIVTSPLMVNSACAVNFLEESGRKLAQLTVFVNIHKVCRHSACD